MTTQSPSPGPPLAASLLLIVASGAWAISAEPSGLTHRDRAELAGYARDTWKSVAAMGDCAMLPVDGLRHQANGTWEPSRLTTPTDIASYVWSVLAAERLKIIGPDEARGRVERTLGSLERVDRVHGFLYDRLDPRTATVLKAYPDNGKPIPPIASAVDNGWLAASLIMVRNSYPTLRERAGALLKPMDFGFFYVPYQADDPGQHPGQMRDPYWIDRQAFGGFNRIINTEQRIAGYIAIARGQVPAEHYYRVERTLRPTEGDQYQVPEGEIRNYMGIPVFEGHYTYRGMQIVPSWGGSMFEALMVTLFVPEELWAPRSWGVNHPLYVRAQIEFGLAEAGYGYWGFSPACNPDGGYRTYGVDALGCDPLGYDSNNDKTRTKTVPSHSTPTGRLTNGVVTPYASFLALRFAPREAMENLRKLKEKFLIYGDHGFRDSVNLTTGVVADRVLILDQGMIMAAIANALADDAMRAAFIDQESERVLRPLIGPEQFTAGPAPPTPVSRPAATGARPPQGQHPDVVVRVDAGAKSRPFPHFWEQMFGSGHANLTMRESWRNDLRAARAITDFRYVRFHDIFHDQNGVYSRGADKQPFFNWSYVDQIYDGILANGVRPFIELSFMPRDLAASQNPHRFWYKPLPNPPRSYQEWGNLIENFARHLEDRYGADEVRQWYFEVWNEPNIDFWTGKPAQATYFELYGAAVKAIKAADRRLRVGGPATAQAAWVGDLIRHCTRTDIPIDFVSTHVYGNDTARNVLNNDESVSRAEMVSRAVRKVNDEVKASPRPDLPIIWSEYNATYKNEADITDSSFMGPWLANNIRLCDGLTTMMAYWTFSDVFEEKGVVKTPFYGGYGLIGVGGIPKAAFNAFAMLHRLGEERLSPELQDALVTKRADGTLVIAVWNYADPGSGGVPKAIELQISTGRMAGLTILDDQHGSALTEWRRMGSPDFPRREQQQALRSAGRLPSPQLLPIEGGAVRLTLAPRGLALIEVTP